MAEETVITSEVKELLGVEGISYTGEVEKDMVRKYAQAIGDTNPLYHDESYAKESRHGSIIAPPTMPFIFTFKTSLPKLPSSLSGGGARAGNSMEFFRPMRPGDVITCTAKYLDIFERDGRSGKLLFKVTEYTYKDQNGEVIAIGKDTSVTFLGREKREEHA